MQRRTLLTLGTGVAVLLAGHRSAVADLEPDSLWLIYRRHSLLIVGQRDDDIASAYAVDVVDVLARYLPSSRARLARTADSRRVGVLIGTNQQDVAVMATESAGALLLGKPPFEDLRNVPLRIIVAFGSHVLACRTDFPAGQAYLLAQTLAEHKDALPSPAAAPEGPVPAHRGSLAFFAGEEVPGD